MIVPGPRKSKDIKGESMAAKSPDQTMTEPNFASAEVAEPGDVGRRA